MDRENIVKLNETIKTKIAALNEVRLKSSDDFEELQRLDFVYYYGHNIDKCLHESDDEMYRDLKGGIYDCCGMITYIPLDELKERRARIEYAIQHYDELLYEAMSEDNTKADMIIANYNTTHKKQIKI